MNTTLLLYLFMTVAFSMILILKIVLGTWAVRSRSSNPWGYVFLGLCLPTVYLLWLSIEGIIEIAGGC